tara:strand:- start:13 stop:399 length:387 start_codon:yes stop_codon:yes gene_type:complete
MRQRFILRGDKVKTRCINWITDFKLNENPVIEIIIRPYKKSRSQEQNDTFHMWCGSIAEHTGHLKEEIKEYLVESAFGLEEYTNIKGETRNRVRQTSSMSVGEMSHLLEVAMRLAREIGADIPEIKHE